MICGRRLKELHESGVWNGLYELMLDRLGKRLADIHQPLVDLGCALIR